MEVHVYGFLSYDGTMRVARSHEDRVVLFYDGNDEGGEEP